MNLPVSIRRQSTLGRTAFAGAALLFLAACTSLPPAPGAPPLPRDAVKDFTLDGRFSLQLNRPDGSAEQAAGRLHWQHDHETGDRAANDQMQLATPLGSGLAELRFTPGAALLVTSDRRQLRGADPAALLQDATGYPLPVTRLPHWLLGRTSGADERLHRDARQRPQHLESPPWRIDYRYPDEHPDALPQRLDISHPEIRLRLFIEQWQTP